MKQTYVKKPEYLDVVYVLDDTQSIKDVIELSGEGNVTVGFNESGDRVIFLEDKTGIPVGNVVFKEKKTGKIVSIPKDKLLQVYDLFSEEAKLIITE